MKILLVQSIGYLYPWSGACKANRIMMEWLVERGHECCVVNPLLSLPGFVEDEYIKNKIISNKLELLESTDNINHVRMNGVESYTIKSEFSIISFLRKFVKDFNPDITLVSDDQLFILLETITELGIKSVFIAHSQAMLPFGPDSMNKEPEKIKLFKKLSGIISVSEFVKNYFLEWAGIESKVFYFPSYGKGPFEYLGGFGNQYITAINPSGLKGISILTGLAKRMPEINFAAVPTWATGVDEIEEIKAIPNIILLKPSENIDDIYRQTKVFLMPSLWGESFGQVVVEAMLRGIPVIASNAGGLTEAKLGVDYVLPVNPIIQYGIDNCLMGSVAKPIIPKQDLEPWVLAVHSLVYDRVHYEKLSRLSYEKALSFHASLSFEILESYLQEIIHKNDDKSNPNKPLPDNKNLLERVNMLSSGKREQLISILRERREKENE